MEDAQEAGPQGDHLFLDDAYNAGSFRLFLNLGDGEVLLGGVGFIDAVGCVVVIFDVLLGFGRRFFKGGSAGGRSGGLLGRIVLVLHPGDLLFIHAVDAHVHLILGGGNLFLFGGFVCHRVDIFNDLTLDSILAVLILGGNGPIQRNVIGNIGDVLITSSFGLNCRYFGVQIVGFLHLDVLFHGLPAGILHLDGGVVFVCNDLFVANIFGFDLVISLGGKFHADGLIFRGLRGSHARLNICRVSHGQIAAVAFGQAVRFGQRFGFHIRRLLRRQLGQQLLAQNLPLLVRDIFRAGQVHFRLRPHRHAQHDHAQHQNQCQQPCYSFPHHNHTLLFLFRKNME